MWDAIAKLGVVSKEDREANMKFVKNMEKRDKEGRRNKKVILNMLR